MERTKQKPNESENIRKDLTKKPPYEQQGVNRNPPVGARVAPEELEETESEESKKWTKREKP